MGSKVVSIRKVRSFSDCFSLYVEDWDFDFLSVVDVKSKTSKHVLS